MGVYDEVVGRRSAWTGETRRWRTSTVRKNYDDHSLAHATYARTGINIAVDTASSVDEKGLGICSKHAQAKKQVSNYCTLTLSLHLACTCTGSDNSTRDIVFLEEIPPPLQTQCSEVLLRCSRFGEVPLLRSSELNQQIDDRYLSVPSACARSIINN
ncbi:hypothetical protein EVAR_3523_1 [Eumeta japonica]|uniref:Uncharacterized protein n=1 Tax=Eumeta variegata TaxID=151549 RepID=A0A4C1SVB9_EUMVA|nr:hypothetical protein EVAR_3523_1 [Eumeta japonica]